MSLQTRTNVSTEVVVSNTNFSVTIVDGCFDHITLRGVGKYNIDRKLIHELKEVVDEVIRVIAIQDEERNKV